MSELLTPRRREALRLDLEDQQKMLIEEVYRLSQGLIHGAVAPPVGFGEGLLESGSPKLSEGRLVAERREGLEGLDGKVRRLREISLALARIGRADFGHCECCGEVIPFRDLARDATRRSCRGGCGRT